MAAEISGEFSVEPELIPGRDGVFDVRVDGEMIFSKYESGRFPSEPEVLDQIRSRA